MRTPGNNNPGGKALISSTLLGTSQASYNVFRTDFHETLFIIHKLCADAVYSLIRMDAAPIPVPIHMEVMPNSPFFNNGKMVAYCLAPVQPNG